MFYLHIYIHLYTYKNKIPGVTDETVTPCNKHSQVCIYYISIYIHIDILIHISILNTIQALKYCKLYIADINLIFV